MKFDIIVGNPPYNNKQDAYFSIKLSRRYNKYMCFIVPGKWKIYEKGTVYDKMRKALVAHIKYICFYPCCKDVFDILQVDGITYFIADRYTHSKCIVENKSKYIKHFNNIRYRSIHDRRSLVNIGDEILKVISNCTELGIDIENISPLNKRFQVWICTKTPGGNFSTVVNNNIQRLFIGICRLIDTKTDSTEEFTPAFKCIFSSDNIDECRSFISWINSKFVRFFLAINQSKQSNIITNDTFRLVPRLYDSKFDHIFTDKELYKMYGLDNELMRDIEGTKYTDIIESIVKDR